VKKICVNKMSSFAKSVNPCGRKISYPKFRALNVPGSPPPPPVTTVAPAPGAEVEESVCQSYYKEKSLQSATPECKSCWQTALDSDASCPCTLDDANPCAFTRCVNTEYNKSGKCAIAYAALFNLDDVNDEQFTPRFAIQDLKDCSQQSTEGWWGSNSSSGTSPSKYLLWGMALLVGIPLTVAVWQARSRSQSKSRL